MSERLARLLADEIGAGGPITFARFMEVALYDPADGFYARPPVGTDGHFVTGPHVSPLYGRLLARQVAEAFDLLGQPEEFALVEFGAGDGTLARQILEAVADAPALAKALRYLAVERSAGAREALARSQIEVYADGEELPSGLTGLVLANELLDNLPFHVVRRDGGELVELLVAMEDDRFVLVPARPTDPALERLAQPLEDGAVGAVSLEGERWLELAAGLLSRGYVLVIDYGGSGPRAPQGYRGQRSELDVLRDPGSNDVTAGVDFDALAAAGRGLGLTISGPVSQRDALKALGFSAYADAERQRTRDSHEAGAHLAAARRWARRSRESILVDPERLGALSFILFGVDVVEPLAAVR